MIAFMSSVDSVGEAANWALVLFARLLDQLLALQQLPLDHVVHVDELVVVGQFALEQAVDLAR